MLFETNTEKYLGYSGLESKHVHSNEEAGKRNHFTTVARKRYTITRGVICYCEAHSAGPGKSWVVEVRKLSFWWLLPSPPFSIKSCNYADLFLILSPGV